MPIEDEVLQVTEFDNSSIWQVLLNAPKANIVDTRMIEALLGVFNRAAEAPNLKAIVLGANGPHFSFGASVEEHQPDEVQKMLPVFHQLIGRMIDAAPYLIAAVQGQCLGGGLEVVLPAQRLICSPDCKLGQPEIELGVFAPVGSALLPLRIGHKHAEKMLMTGKGIRADEAHRIGLVDEIAEKPLATALDFARKHFAGKSASSMRQAMLATREDLKLEFVQRINKLENRYLNDLMNTADAKEGIAAFLEKRPAEWRDQ